MRGGGCVCVSPSPHRALRVEVCFFLVDCLGAVLVFVRILGKYSIATTIRSLLRQGCATPHKDVQCLNCNHFAASALVQLRLIISLSRSSK